MWSELSGRESRVLVGRAPRRGAHRRTTGLARGRESGCGDGVAGEFVISSVAGHVTLLHSVRGLARIELLVADCKGIGAG